MGRIAASTLWSTRAQLPTMAPLRFLLAPKTQISRALRQICMFCAMDTGRQQIGVLLSKGFTLAGGFFVVQRRYCCNLTNWKEGKNYGLVEWIDPSWPNTLENALSKLWFMYEQSKRDRNEDSLMH
ncbi:hypothetical protein ACQJBY_000717 [Aegilops geniculata]